MQPYTFVLLCGLAGSALAQNYVPFNGATWENFGSRPTATNAVTALTDSIPSIWQTELPKPTPRTTDLVFTPSSIPQSKAESSPLAPSSVSPPVFPSSGSASPSVSESASASSIVASSTIASSSEVSSTSPSPTISPTSSRAASSTSAAPASSSSRAAAYTLRADYVGVVAGGLFAGLIL